MRPVRRSAITAGATAFPNDRDRPSAPAGTDTAPPRRRRPPPSTALLVDPSSASPLVRAIRIHVRLPKSNRTVRHLLADPPGSPPAINGGRAVARPPDESPHLLPSARQLAPRSA